MNAPVPAQNNNADPNPIPNMAEHMLGGEWEDIDEENDDGDREEVTAQQDGQDRGQNLQNLMNNVLNMDLNSSMGNFIRENE